MEGRMDTQIKKIGLITLASYFIFRFYFSFVSISIQQLLLFGFIGIYFLFHLPEFKRYFLNLGKNKTIFLIAILFYSSIIIFSFVIPILYRTNDFSYLKSQLRYISYTLTFIILVHLVHVHLRPNNLKDELLKIYTIVCRNYVLVSIVMLIIPPIKYFWQSIIHETERNLHLVNTKAEYAARWGWAGYSGFAITLQITIAVAFLIYLILKDMENGKKLSINHLSNLVILLIGTAFYGRVGLLTSLAIIGLAILYLIFSKGKIFLGVGIIGSLLTLFIGLTILKDMNTSIESWYNWAMDPILDILQSGSIQTSSTDTLLDMYFIPDWHTLLFGDGQYVDNLTGGYYMAVDVGYLRPTLFYGIFLLIIGYMVPVLLLYTLVKSDKKNISLMLLLMFVMFIFELKGEVYMTIIPITFMLFYAESIAKYEQVTNKENKVQKMKRYHICENILDNSKELRI